MRLSFKLSIIVTISILAADLYANSTIINPDNTFTKETSAGVVTCAEIDSSGYLAGILKGSDKFVTYTVLKAKTKSKVALKTGIAKAKLKLKLKKYKKREKEGNLACATGPDNSNPPGGSPPSGGNFDLQGNVTEIGKINFGIPANLSANVDVGLGIYNSMCVGCHTANLNRSFTDYREKTKLSPMLYDEISLPDNNLANLTAYLNRFRLP